MAKKKSTAKKKPKKVDHLTHEEATRKNNPTAEMQSVVRDEVKTPVQVAYERRNPDLDPQFVWRGKDDGPLNVSAPPLYIQEKVHPKALMDDLLRQTRNRAGIEDDGYHAPDLFADFNGLPEEAKSTDFYRHEGHWSNRMILGDSLQVMASLAEREGLRGKVQCIYIDPPYGIKFNSNFQWSTTSRDVKDGNTDHLTREPEMVKAFRDTWREGIHSYLTYLRDRLTVARDLLNDSGSIFVQIGDENVHRVRALMDEIFGEDNLMAQIAFKTTDPLGQSGVAKVYDHIIWYGKCVTDIKFRSVYRQRDISTDKEYRFVDRIYDPKPPSDRESKEFLASVYRRRNATSSGFTPSCTFDLPLFGRTFSPAGRKSWSSNQDGMARVAKADRFFVLGKAPYYKQYHSDFPISQLENVWTDKPPAQAKRYVVETAAKFIQRCILMTTDPGDLILDPTCGSGTTAHVAEQWGRRWITIDTSRVALALARARIMGARHPFHLLADSTKGREKEAEITRNAPSDKPVHNNIRHGFVYERVSHITLKLIANNAEIDVIYEEFQQKLEPLRESLNTALGKSLGEWEIPRDAEDAWVDDASKAFVSFRNEEQKSKGGTESKRLAFLKVINDHLGTDFTVDSLPERPADPWPEEAAKIHAEWWEHRIARQKEIDASIAAKADHELLYDRPYEDKSKVRVAGPFTVESVSPHRILSVGENEDLIDTWDKIAEETDSAYGGRHQDFATVILANLQTAGVQQRDKEDRIVFTGGLSPIAGNYVCAVGIYTEGDSEGAPERRAGIFIGEFGTVSRPDLVAAAREAGDMGHDVLIACAFNYDAHSAEFEKLGALPVLKARMNSDLHMAEDLKNTGKGNLFVIFGEPDIDIKDAEDGKVQVHIKGVDVFKPSSGEVVSSDAKDIACWFIDTDYNEESFFVRHAYFLGQNDPYKSLKTTLKAEIDEEAWFSLNKDISRPFPKPTTGRIAVKVINHLGDEVMKVFSVS